MNTTHASVPATHGQKSTNPLASPGGHIDPGESSREAAARELAEETGVHVATGDLREFGTWEQPGRDSRGRYSTDACLAVVPVGTLTLLRQPARRTLTVVRALRRTTAGSASASLSMPRSSMNSVTSWTGAPTPAVSAAPSGLLPTSTR
ncbi:NUDIX domain-containing protein [Streptomyces sp. NPDC052069]|uniref:NUDIX domain-containing protein n=1 Tax=Streptomyces sp. NPDC052069 TaxID=3154650 RepID=UPI00343B3273